MKNKKVTYLLLAATLIIWVLVVKRVVLMTGAESPAAIHPELSGLTDKTVVPERLLLDYRDPFIGNPIAKQIESAGQEANFIEPVPQPPEVEFKGVVINGKTLYGIIRIGNGTDLVQHGETLGDFVVKSIGMDSIVFQRGGFEYPVYRH